MWGQKNKERKRKENWEYKLSGKLWRVNVLALKNLLEAFLLLTLIIILCLQDISDLILSVLWRRSESNANESYRWSRLLFRGKVMTDEVSPGQIYRCPVEGDACARCLWQKTRISLQRDDVRTFRSQEPQTQTFQNKTAGTETIWPFFRTYKRLCCWTNLCFCSKWRCGSKPVGGSVSPSSY